MERPQEEIAVCISSYSRTDLLEKAVDSVLKQDYPFVKVYIITMCFPEIHERMREKYYSNPNVRVYFFPEQTSYVTCQNFVSSITTSHILYAADDIELHPDCVSVAWKTLNEKFPDLDGIIGFNQENMKGLHPYKGAFGLIGRRYLDRFTSRKWLFPKFFGHFSDMYSTFIAEKLGKFYYEENAKVIHHHPLVTKIKDTSTVEILKHHHTDNEIREILLSLVDKHYWGDGKSDQVLIDATRRFCG
jgi:glycosyltransferase involved in cell wall biosynthesis